MNRRIGRVFELLEQYVFWIAGGDLFGAGDGATAHLEVHQVIRDRWGQWVGNRESVCMEDLDHVAATGGLEGDEAAAVREWRTRRDRRARFWLGVALRHQGIAEGDSILRVEFAERPGFDLLQAAARDTLGLPGWPRGVLAPAPDTLEPQLGDALVRLSGELMLPDAAARLVSARDRADVRLPRGPQRMFAASSWRAVAVAAYAIGGTASDGLEQRARTIGRDQTA